MATFTARSFFPPVWMDSLPTAVSTTWLTKTSSTASFAAGTNRYEYHGSFTYVGDSIVGTLNSLSYVNYRGTPQYTVSDLSYDAQSISRLMTAGSHAELLPILLSGDDVIDGRGTYSLMGYGGNDTIIGGKYVDGGDGIDTAVLDFGRASVYTMNIYNGGVQFLPEYNLKNVERLKFTDGSLALDINGNAGKAYRLYQAAFDRKPDLGGLGAQMNGLDRGTSLLQISQNFINSKEFELKYGTNLSNEVFITQLYANVLHRAPDPGGYAAQLNALNTGMSKAQLLVNFSESTENYNATLVGIKNGIEYTPVA